MLNVNELSGFGAGGDAAHQYWRLASMVPATGIGANYMSMSNLVIHEDVGGTADVIRTVGGTYAASDYWIAYQHPQYAVDADTTTAWAATNEAIAHWYSFAFNAPVRVAEILISAYNTFYQFGPVSFTLEYSDNGTDWTFFKNVTGSDTVWASGETRTFIV